MSPIQLAIESCGGQRRLADAIGVHPSFVSQWVTGRRPVPAEHCRAIETASEGRVTRYELRPDVFGEPPGAANDGNAASEKQAVA